MKEEPVYFCACANEFIYLKVPVSCVAENWNCMFSRLHSKLMGQPRLRRKFRQGQLRIAFAGGGIKELQELLDIVSYSDAANLMRAIRAKSARPNKRGKCFVQDYIEFFGLDIARYVVINQLEAVK